MVSRPLLKTLENLMVALTTLETRRLRADMIEVYTILRGFERTDEVKFSKEEWDVQEGMTGNCLKSVLILMPENLVSEIGFVTNGTSCRGGLSMWKV